MSIIDRQNDFENDFEPRKSEVSMLAIVAFIVAILACIPFAPPIGVVLGMVAIVRLMGQPNLRGRGLAVAAIVLGLCFSIGWGLGLFVLIREVTAIKQFVEEAPNDTMRLAFDGDIDGFRAEFATDHPREVAEAFVAELRSRYGEFSAMAATGAPAGAGTPADGDRMIIPVRYVATFDSGSVDLQVELLLSVGGRTSIRPQLESISVVDRGQPPLRYPPLPPPPGGQAPDTPAPSDTEDPDALMGDAPIGDAPGEPGA